MAMQCSTPFEDRPRWYAQRLRKVLCAVVVFFSAGVLAWYVFLDRRDVYPTAVFEYEGLGVPSCVAISPDGRRVLAGVFDASSHKGGILVWDLESRKQLFHLAKKLDISSFALSPKAGFLVAGCGVGEGQGGKIVIFQGDAYEETAILRFDGPVTDVAVSPDGCLLAAYLVNPIGGTILKTWDFPSLDPLDEVRFPGIPFVENRQDTRAASTHKMAFSPHGDILAIVAVTIGPPQKTDAIGQPLITSNIKFYNTKSRIVVASREVPNIVVYNLDFAEHGETLLAAGDLGEILPLVKSTRWPRLTDKPIPRASFRFTPSGDGVLFGGRLQTDPANQPDAFAVGIRQAVWDLNVHDIAVRFRCPNSSLTETIGISSDGRYLLTGSMHKVIMFEIPERYRKH